MKLLDVDRGLARADFRHRVHVDLVNFESGVAAWRAKCTCGWKSSVKTTDAGAAAETATAHASGWVWGQGHDLFDAS